MISKEDILAATILIVDDQESSTTLLKDMLTKAGYHDITCLQDPLQACDRYVETKPSLLILDLNMPKLNGFEVLAQLKEVERDNYLPVLIISNEESPEARFLALESGAKDFIHKPFDRAEVLIRIYNLLEVRMLHTQVRHQNIRLEDMVKDRTKELYDTQLDVIHRLARSIEYRDCETGHHILRISHYCACLAAQAGMSMQDCEMILTASPLHDIGKIGIPDTILLKPGKLSDKEWVIMKTHTTIGAELLAGGTSQYLKIARDIALSHHERWDGQGYPQQLAGVEIPITARICCIVDVFDALTSERPYKKAWSFEDALEEIEKGKGSFFDPKLVEDFLQIKDKIRFIYEKYVDSKVSVEEKHIETFR